ncbi:hypothetical protein AAY473_034128 [Plecturocebus cupreus]
MLENFEESCVARRMRKEFSGGAGTKKMGKADRERGSGRSVGKAQCEEGTEPGGEERVGAGHPQQRSLTQQTSNYRGQVVNPRKQQSLCDHKDSWHWEQWLMPLFPAFWEAEAGGSPELKNIMFPKLTGNLHCEAMGFAPDNPGCSFQIGTSGASANSENNYDISNSRTHIIKFKVGFCLLITMKKKKAIPHPPYPYGEEVQSRHYRALQERTVIVPGKPSQQALGEDKENTFDTMGSAQSPGPGPW